MIERHFVTFLSPGTLVHEKSTMEIEGWDVKSAVEMSHNIKERHGATPFAFQFSTRAREDHELDSKVTARSGRYYLGGEILTLADIRNRNDPADEILIRNMEGNGWDRVVVNSNSWKITQPLDADDVVLSDLPRPEGVS